MWGIGMGCDGHLAEYGHQDQREWLRAQGINPATLSHRMWKVIRPQWAKDYKGRLRAERWEHYSQHGTFTKVQLWAEWMDYQEELERMASELEDQEHQSYMWKLVAAALERRLARVHGCLDTYDEIGDLAVQLGNVLRAHQKEFSNTTKQAAIRTLEKWYRGCCPWCRNETRRIVKDGKLINGHFHHWQNMGGNHWSICLPLCTACHDDITRCPARHTEATNYFDPFQQKMAEEIKSHRVASRSTTSIFPLKAKGLPGKGGLLNE